MAIKTGQFATYGGGASVITWAGLANADSGSAGDLVGSPDKTVQVTGTFGAGGSVTLQGSNDGTNWETLSDPLGTALTFTAAGLKAVLENPLYIRPIVTAGDGTTDLAVTLCGIDND